MTPSVGRIVHYVSYGTPGGEFQSECRAAIIAAVNGGAPPHWGSGGERLEGEESTVSLVVFNPQGLFFNECIHDEEEKKGGTWHWPERADDPHAPDGGNHPEVGRHPGEIGTTFERRRERENT